MNSTQSALIWKYIMIRGILLGTKRGKVKEKVINKNVNLLKDRIGRAELYWYPNY